ncbi:hypothetical protein EMA8858_00911 [Emticicia aquatica]|jgi:hypothetical protein|uniref:Heme NO-binding domain-containing protein n=1 Tax=Emticicia aquatica TaxID=1681835 RepID=A0ABM9AM36_9BACT|nr:heme NO-binding domain-containing protein [Emticicia aquatica]CAH0994799.1 hypothetical protein EMA8858_00911 [Emticicia aquatica]
MKGIVFTEFIEMVEKQFGYEMIDKIILSSDLKSGGAYTTVGTYDHKEMSTLVHALSTRTNIPVAQLYKIYGNYLFKILYKNYPFLFEKSTNAFEFLEGIDNHIHIAVKKLYPDAELPNFEITRLSNNVLEMIYHSERKMSDFADGLIEGALEHFQEKATVQKELLVEDGSKAKFIISKV